jgi:hypothetical protein
MLVTVFATSLSASSQHTSFGWSNRVLPRPKVNCLGRSLAREKTPLDLSIAKAQVGPWVFEVKYVKYTLFTLILLRRQTPMWRQPPSAVKVLINGSPEERRHPDGSRSSGEGKDLASIFEYINDGTKGAAGAGFRIPLANLTQSTYYKQVR